MKIKTLNDLTDIEGKRILLRVDFNVPTDDKGNIEDDTRIQESLPTIKHLSKQGGKIIIVTHFGRPEGKKTDNLKVDFLAKHLGKILKQTVKKADEVLGKNVEEMIKKMKNGDIIMLENIRFEKEEEENDQKFAKKLAKHADIFVNDAFGTAHRAHASTSSVAQYLDSYAGFLLEKEINSLTPLVKEEPIRPLTLILGGAKIDTKIGLIKSFVEKADFVLLGGGLANTFLAAAGYNIADSLYEEDKLEIARDTMLEFQKHHTRLILPKDVTVAEEISDKAETANVMIQNIPNDVKILDIGKWTIEHYCDIIQESGTVIWNGPLGMYEYKPFRNSTLEIATTLAKHECDSIIGGGDTVDAIKKVNIPAEAFTHISTGGGACIEFLEGKKLPGIQALMQK